MTTVLLPGLSHWPFNWVGVAVMTPLAWYLRWRGHNVICMAYDGGLEEFDTIVDRVTALTPVTIIGHSYGGIIARAAAAITPGCTAIMIASPVKGARFIRVMETLVPWYFRGNKGYEFIKTTKYVPDTLACHTISVGLPGFPDFDSCVYRDEATARLDDHTHINWSEHRVAPLDPRVWTVVCAQLGVV
jgi:pimeloyl-ACP methyl ester carboxylesterase